MPFGAIVSFQRTDIHHIVRAGELLVDGIQKTPVARAPTVDALFDVTHDEILGIDMTHTLLQQHFKVLPLNGRGVLKLVNHHMLKSGSNFFKDEWRIAVFDERMEQLLRIAEQETVRLVIHLAHLLLDAAKKAELVKMS